ncbi:MAG: hypothetical protein EXS58_14915 [Candidatus Latescibacteria bacterium]|nr:hypothetical protein [Candidatus Latescibacterota bacterium]
MAKTLNETIVENLKYVSGVDGILGKFYYVSDPDELRQAIENWLVNTPDGRTWLDAVGFINKSTVVKVVEQIEANLEQSSQELLTKVQTFKSYVNSKGNQGRETPLVSELR